MKIQGTRNTNVFALKDWKDYCQTLIGNSLSSEDEIIMATHKVCAAIQITKRIAANHKP